MIRFLRGASPDALAKHAGAVAQDYREKRRNDPGHTFRWPQRDGQSLLVPIREALASMGGGRCAYCDGYPIDATGEIQVDHFRPKSRFPMFVCTWPNLFLVCSACNGEKGEQWDSALLKPDGERYQFDRYFVYRADTGELLANPGAAPPDQVRARTTIELLGLNRPGNCIQRKKTVRQMSRLSPVELEDYPYRFLHSLRP